MGCVLSGSHCGNKNRAILPLAGPPACTSDRQSHCDKQDRIKLHTSA